MVLWDFSSHWLSKWKPGEFLLWNTNSTVSSNCNQILLLALALKWRKPLKPEENNSPAPSTEYFYISELSVHFTVLQIRCLNRKACPSLCASKQSFSLYIYTCVCFHTLTLSIYIDIEWAFRYLKKDKIT